MPIYEFECIKGGHVFEKFMGYSDPMPKSCPKCNSHVRKLISQTSFQLKGTGWYVTDYKNNGNNKERKEEVKKEKKKEEKKEKKAA